MRFKTTKRLIHEWVYNINPDVCRQIENELERRGVKLDAETVQKYELDIFKEV